MRKQEQPCIIETTDTAWQWLQCAKQEVDKIRGAKMLSSSEERVLEQILENLNQGIVYVDQERKIRLCNKKAKEITALPSVHMTAMRRDVSRTAMW